VTAADVAKAREAVRPSLDPAQVEALKAFSATR
jgi:transitional endoplasmic reticulum ATPase